MDVDLPQVTIALDSIKILDTDKNSKGTVVKYHPISKIEADHLMILPVGTKVSIHGLKTRTELNDTVRLRPVKNALQIAAGSFSESMHENE